MSTRKIPERPRAILVSLIVGPLSAADADERAAEAARLVESAGASVAATMRARRDRPDAKTYVGSGKVEEVREAAREHLDAKTYVGSGKVEEVREAAREHRAEMVVFDNALSAAQVRNLEQALSEEGPALLVYDRTDLILNIFAQRAQSHEGKLQVELARLEHLSTRLVRGWTHLERQRGGLGKTGGPGEKQIELDRRMIGERVKKLKDRIRKLTKSRHTQRAGRMRSGLLRVALVGYTNAGKSTLFNRLTRAGSYVANQLFATLDTTTRKLWLAPGAEIAISDTVGFIRELPHSLVDAFRATLEETAQADLLLHVVDCANPQRDEQVEAVNKVLKEIGAGGVPQIIVWNKIDQMPGLEPEVVRDTHGKILNIKVSAGSGAGIDLLRDVLAEAARDASGPLASAA